MTERADQDSNHSWGARIAWGGVLLLGAASAMVPALFPNFATLVAGHARWGHEAPVLAMGVDRESATPAEAPAASAVGKPAPSAVTLTLTGNVTDPDDTRAAVALDGVLWVATGGGLLRMDPAAPDADRWWTTADGLPDHRLTAITPWEGGLALGTEAGTVFTVDLPDGGPVHVRSVVDLGDARISDLLAEDELLWVGTWGEGAFVGEPHRPEGFRALGPSRGLRARRITGLARLDGELVAGTAGAGLWVRGDDGRSRLFVQKGGLISDFVLDVQRVGDRVVATGPGGVSRYRAGTLQTLDQRDQVAPGVVRAAADTREGTLLALTGGRLGRLGSGDATELPQAPDGLLPWHGVPRPEVRWLAEVGDRLAAGTARGILLREGPDAPWTWRTHEGPGSNDLTSVSARDGDVLVGTFDTGAWQRRRDAWAALPGPSGEVNDVQLEADGAWLATSHGLARVDDDGLRSWSPLHGLAHPHVAALAASPDGLLVGTSAGVQRFDGVGFRSLGDGTDLSNVYSVVAHEGGAWAGTLEGLWALDGPDADRFRYETGELPDSWANAVAVADDGRVWVGTYDHGLATRDPVNGTWAFLTEDAGLPCGWVNPDALLPLPDGSVLVGTMGGGLLRVSAEGPLDRWMPVDGLAGDDVTGLARDGDTVWVATRSGLSTLSLEIHDAPSS